MTTTMNAEEKAHLKGLQKAYRDEKRRNKDATPPPGDIRLTLKRWLEADPSDPNVDPKVLGLSACQRCSEAIGAMQHGLTRSR